MLSVVAEGYQQHHFKKHDIKISTLDFHDVLEVTEPELFIQEALYKGIGLQLRAAFFSKDVTTTGFGLYLVHCELHENSMNLSKNINPSS